MNTKWINVGCMAVGAAAAVHFALAAQGPGPMQKAKVVQASEFQLLRPDGKVAGKIIATDESILGDHVGMELNGPDGKSSITIGLAADLAIAAGGCHEDRMMWLIASSKDGVDFELNGGEGGERILMQIKDGRANIEIQDYVGKVVWSAKPLKPDADD